MSKQSRDGRRRVLIIGLDGATLDLLGPWVQAGKLPALAGLMQRGSWARLRSVLPVLSPSAWASFLTGVNPGRHGIYDFMRRVPNGYGLRLSHLGHNRAPTLWRIMNGQGRKAVVMNVPTTYPPEPLDGALVSGLGTPDFKPFAYPPAVGDELTRRGYRVNPNAAFRPGREEAYLRAQRDYTLSQREGVLWAMRDLPWDLFCYVVRGTDEVAHYYWKHMDPTHPAHDPVRDAPWKDAMLEYYQLCDGLVADMLAEAGPDVTVLVMSDHGMGPLYKEVYLNEWLRQEGYLVLQPRRPAQRALLARAGITRARVSGALRRLHLGFVERVIKDALGERIRVLPRDTVMQLDDAVDWRQTRAYSHGYHGQIYLNVRGREPQGTVEPGAEYEALRSEIMDKLSVLVDPADGGKLVSEVHPREALYHGPMVGDASDIVAILRGLSYITRYGREFGDKPNTFLAEPYDGLSASHRLDGVLIAAGPGVESYGKEREILSIMDVLPTSLHIMRMAVPEGLDGKVALDWLEEADRTRPVTFTEVSGGAQASGSTDFTEEEEAEVTARLKDLGYLG